MNLRPPFAMQACLAWLTLLPLAMPVLVFAALWLAVPWQFAWWLVCTTGMLLCVVAAWRRPGALAMLSLVAGGYAVCALLVLWLDLNDAPMANAVLSASASATGAVSPLKVGPAWLLAGLALIFLLVGVVGLTGSAWRALRSNVPLQVRPRQLLGGLANVCICVALFAGLLVAGQAAGRHQSNLQLVDKFAQMDVQLFTPVRYAREVLATSYYWRADPATPKLATWLGIPISGYFGGTEAANSYIAAHTHPVDKWSGAAQYDTAIDREIRDEQGSGDGLELAYEPAPADATQQAQPGSRKAAATALIPTVLIANVAPGSAAALAGVQRGDMLVSIDGELSQAFFARLDREAKAKSVGEASPAMPNAMPLAQKAPPVLHVRRQDGKIVEITTRNPYKTTGVQAVSWHTRGGTAMAPGLRTELLYLRLERFAPHTGLYAEKAIRESAQAVVYPANPSRPDPTKWPRLLLDVGIQTLVIDLRNNPGGSKNAVADLARRLLGMYLQPGLGLPEAQVDDRGIASSQPVLWLENPSLAAGAVASPLTAIAQRQQAGLLRGLKNIMVLTSRNTCSAAELLIHGLQKHLPSTIRFATVGDTTCGKPHGYKEHDYFGTTIFAVHLTLLDAANQPAYPNGIAPTCQVKDLILGPEAGDYDLVFQAAINYAQQGKCQ